MPKSKTPSVSPSAAEERPCRPFTAYNIFFQIERERIIQENYNAEGDAAKPRRTSTLDIDTDEASKRPPAYRHLILRKNWHIVDPQRRKRLGTKKNRPAPHGVLTFIELSRKISSNWKTIDEETKRYCHDMASKELVRYRKDMEAFVQKYGQEAAKKTYKRKTNKKIEPEDVESMEPIPALTVLENGVSADAFSFEVDEDSEMLATNTNDFPIAFHPVDEDEEIRPNNEALLSEVFCMPAEQFHASASLHHVISTTPNHQGSTTNNRQPPNKYCWVDGNMDTSFRSIANKQDNDAAAMNRDNSLPDPLGIMMNQRRNMAMREAFESMFNTNSMTSSSIIEGYRQWSRMDHHRVSPEASPLFGGRRSLLPDAPFFPSFVMTHQDPVARAGAMGQNQNGNNQTTSRKVSLCDNYCFPQFSMR